MPPNAGPRLLYWGPAATYERHPEAATPALPSSADERTENELFPLPGKGFFGEPALVADGAHSGIFGFHLNSTEHQSNQFTLIYSDAISDLTLTLHYKIDQSGILISQASIQNTGSKSLPLHRLNALTLPIPQWMNMVDLTFGGWSKEGHHKRVELTAGKIERTGFSGRPGFDGGPHLLLTEMETNETTGTAIGITLANSGNFTLAAECMGHGEKQACISELLQPGEVTLFPGTVYQTPLALAAISTEGLNALSTQFHAHARQTAPRTRRHRPVQLNSWEAMYFGIDEPSAMRLAKSASDIGAERFVLDDGWFKNRHNDHQALGDWTPDSEKYPNGLGPLVQYTNDLGLEFGLWLEPEMVSEDSDLFRRHPDWILSTDGKPGPTGRHQLVLNLARTDVQDYLFSTIDRLLTTIEIAYLKWDCNRDIFPAATSEGPTTHNQIAGLYALLKRIRDAHPNLSIESCASGGGRIDFGVLQHTDRFWASDSTDPFERARIQRRSSIFYPTELLGAHIGTSPNHWTGRQSSMSFRCLVAFFGHFGIELDPHTLNEFDRNILMRTITLYKKYRDIIVDGTLNRFNNADDALDIQVIVATDKTRALLRILRMEESQRHALPPIRIPGLPAQCRWRLSEIAIEGSGQNRAIGEFSSEWLSFSGVEINPAHAGQGRLYLLEKT